MERGSTNIGLGNGAEQDPRDQARRLFSEAFGAYLEASSSLNPVLISRTAGLAHDTGYNLGKFIEPGEWSGVDASTLGVALEADKFCRSIRTMQTDNLRALHQDKKSLDRFAKNHQPSFAWKDFRGYHKPFEKPEPGANIYN